MALSLNKSKLDNLAGDIWKSAERLRGKFKAYEYQSVILPIIVIRRLECVLLTWREVFADALTDRASAIIVAHNHPSGGVKPSPSDINITAQLKAAGEIIGIELLDHIIFNRTEYFSFLENNIVD